MCMTKWKNYGITWQLEITPGVWARFDSDTRLCVADGALKTDPKYVYTASGDHRVLLSNLAVEAAGDTQWLCKAFARLTGAKKQTVQPITLGGITHRSSVDNKTRLNGVLLGVSMSNIAIAIYAFMANYMILPINFITLAVGLTVCLYQTIDICKRSLSD